MISDDEDQDMADVSYGQKDDDEEEAAEAVSSFIFDIEVIARL